MSDCRVSSPVQRDNRWPPYRMHRTTYTRLSSSVDAPAPMAVLLIAVLGGFRLAIPSSVAQHPSLLSIKRRLTSYKYQDRLPQEPAIPWQCCLFQADRIHSSPSNQLCRQLAAHTCNLPPLQWQWQACLARGAVSQALRCMDWQSGQMRASSNLPQL